MSRPTLLVVDLSNQVYKAVASHQGLTSKRVFTGGLYGFLVSLCVAIKETHAHEVVIGGDSRPYIRSRDYPMYKKLRAKDPDDPILKAFQQSMGLVKDLCVELGLPIWMVPGFEYDDLIAHCIMKYRHRYGKIVAMSNDSDLQQLLWAKNFSIYKGKKGGFYGLSEFEKEWPGITPDQIPMAIAMMGSHNDVEGISGLGPKTAIKALRDPFKMREIRAKHAALIDRNLPLIQLPHAEFPYGQGIPKPFKAFDSPRSLYRFCGTYDITVESFMIKALEQVLR